jgi:hypothetical protein
MAETRSPAAIFRGDIISWGSVWAGLVTAIAVLVLLSILGVAIGLSSAPAGAPPPSLGSAAGLWGLVVIVVSLFVGGWTASSTSAISNRSTGVLHGAMVWGLTLIIGLILSVLGLGAVLGVLGEFGFLAFGGSAGVTAGDLAGAAWGTLIGLFLALIFAMLGGFFGARESAEVRY